METLLVLIFHSLCQLFLFFVFYGVEYESISEKKEVKTASDLPTVQDDCNSIQQSKTTEVTVEEFLEEEEEEETPQIEEMNVIVVLETKEEAPTPIREEHEVDVGGSVGSVKYHHKEDETPSIKPSCEYEEEEGIPIDKILSEPVIEKKENKETEDPEIIEKKETQLQVGENEIFQKKEEEEEHQNSGEFLHNLTSEDFTWTEMIFETDLYELHLCHLKKTNERYLIKKYDRMTIAREKMTKSLLLERKALEEEINDHPFIIKLVTYFEDRKSAYFVLEDLHPKTLHDFRIQRGGRLPPKIARYYICELILAVEYLQKHKVVHRSIRPSKIWIDGRSGHLQLADFLYSKMYKNPNKAVLKRLMDRTFAKNKFADFNGYASYVTPETMKDKPQSYTADIYCVAITLFQLLTGRLPYESPSPYLLFKKIKERKISWGNDMLEPETKDFIDQVIRLDPKKRLGNGRNGFKRIKAHPYFEGVKWKKILKNARDKVPVKWEI